VWQTDRWADGQTDGQNYDSQDRASIAASRGKNRLAQKIHSESSSQWSQSWGSRKRVCCGKDVWSRRDLSLKWQSDDWGEWTMNRRGLWHASFWDFLAVLSEYHRFITNITTFHYIFSHRQSRKGPLWHCDMVKIKCAWVKRLRTTDLSKSKHARNQIR